MARLVRYEFLGSTVFFWLLCLTGVLVPFAVIYLLHRTVRIEEEMEDPDEFVRQVRSGKLRI